MACNIVSWGALKSCARGKSRSGRDIKGMRAVSMSGMYDIEKPATLIENESVEALKMGLME